MCVLRALIPCGAPALRAATPLRLLEGAPPGAPTDAAPGPRHLGLGGGKLAHPAVPSSSLPSTTPGPTPLLCAFLRCREGAPVVALDCFLLPGSRDSGRCCTPVYSAVALRARPTRVDAVTAVRLAPHRLRAFLSPVSISSPRQQQHVDSSPRQQQHVDSSPRQQHVDSSPRQQHVDSSPGPQQLIDTSPRPALGPCSFVFQRHAGKKKNQPASIRRLPLSCGSPDQH